MKSTKPTLSMLTMFLIGSLYASPTFAADLNTSGGADITVPGVNATTSGNATVTTPADPATPANPASAGSVEKSKAYNTNRTGTKNTNMRNKDCDVNVSANANSNSSSNSGSTYATRNCDDTSKPKK